MKTHNDARDLSKANLRTARAARAEAPCRTCGRMIKENLRWESEQVAIDGGGIASVDRYTSAKTFGPYGDRICTLRCGYAYAAEKAPR